MDRPPWWQSTTVFLPLSSSSPLRTLGPLRRFVCIDNRSRALVVGVGLQERGGKATISDQQMRTPTHAPPSKPRTIAGTGTGAG